MGEENMSDTVWARWQDNDLGCSGLHEDVHYITRVEVCNSQPCIVLRTAFGQLRLYRTATPLVEQIKHNLYILFRAGFTDEDVAALDDNKMISMEPNIPIPLMVKMYKEPDQVKLTRAIPREFARWFVDTVRHKGELHENQGQSVGSQSSLHVDLG